jgi:hypothetical protein
MNSERVIDLLHARPFQPFGLIVSNELLTIDDPDLAKLHEDGETLIVTHHRAQAAERWTRFVDLRLIEEMIIFTNRSAKN